jgi:hypothetical protein
MPALEDVGELLEGRGYIPASPLRAGTAPHLPASWWAGELRGRWLSYSSGTSHRQSREDRSQRRPSLANSSSGRVGFQMVTQAVRDGRVGY